MTATSTSTPAAHPAQAAQGFLLLALNNVEALLPDAQARIVDQLALECVTLPVPVQITGGADIERDVWLVLRVGPHEMPISPTQVVRHSRTARTFVFEGGGIATGAKWAIKLPEPHGPQDVDDLETFEVILAQYAAVEEVDVDGSPPDHATSSTYTSAPFDTSAPSLLKGLVPPPRPSQSSATPPHPPLPLRSLPSIGPPGTEGDLKGRLILVYETDGEVVGTLGEQFHIHEDEALKAKGHEKDPVIVELPEYEEGARATEVYVHPVPIEQQDTIMKTASLISRGIVFATDALTTGFGAASSFYIAHSTPTAQPLVFSESTRGHVRRVHNISGKAVEVTAKTTGLIHEALERAVDYVSGSNNSGKGKGRTQANVSSSVPGTPPPRLPLKNRILLSTDMLLTTVENSAKQLLEHGSQRMSDALGHKYGKDMGDASLLVGRTVCNVGIVYVDARGVGRRALLRKAGKKYIKAKLGHRDVVLGIDEHGAMQEMSGAAASGDTGSAVEAIGGISNGKRR